MSANKTTDTTASTSTVKFYDYEQTQTKRERQRDYENAQTKPADKKQSATLSSILFGDTVIVGNTTVFKREIRSLQTARPEVASNDWRADLISAARGNDRRERVWQDQDLSEREPTMSSTIAASTSSTSSIFFSAAWRRQARSHHGTREINDQRFA